MYGKILKIDLTSERISKEPISEELRRKYLGGEGINDYLLWQHFLNVNVKGDPLDPNNVLILGLGPLGATGYGAGSKMKWTFKSPLTNAFGDSSCGGFLGANLRWSGYDHIVITGKAKHPSYIWVNDDLVEIRDARRLWGKNTLETHEIIKEEVGEAELETACIGIAGENLVRYASIISSQDRSAGRTGAGCVMASKNIKAIAARGTGAVKICNPQCFLESCDALAASLNKSPKAVEYFIRYGTHTVTERYNDEGWSALRNNQYSVIPEEKMAKLHQDWYEKNLRVAQLACSPGCAFGCGGICKIKGDESPAATRYAGFYSRPEYTAMGAFGTMCDIPDMPACTYLWNLCDRYGVDVAEVGSCSAFLMELWQRKVISQQDIVDWFGKPVSLEWGNYEAVEKIIHSVGRQNNKMGEILKQGLYKAAQIISDLKNVPVLKYAIYGKFGVAHFEDMRSRLSWSTGFAVSSRGCDHLKSYVTPDNYGSQQLSMMYFGTPEAARPLTITLKGASTALAENRQALANCLGVCCFVINRGIPIPVELLSNALAVVTGMEITSGEMRAAGERTVNLEKAFNSRLGFRREDDKLCERWMKEEVQEGPKKGWKAENFISQTLDEYYEWHGWDKRTSLQTRKKLEELDMKDVAKVLEKEGALA